MTRSRLTRVFVAASALAVSSSAPALAHGTADVRCGSVLTTDTTLRHDLLGCVGDGLVIGADGIKIDLNGRRLGSGQPEPAQHRRAGVRLYAATHVSELLDLEDRLGALDGNMTVFPLADASTRIRAALPCES